MYFNYWKLVIEFNKFANETILLFDLILVFTAFETAETTLEESSSLHVGVRSQRQLQGEVTARYRRIFPPLCGFEQRHISKH